MDAIRSASVDSFDFQRKKPLGITHRPSPNKSLQQNPPVIFKAQVIDRNADTKRIEDLEKQVRILKDRVQASEDASCCKILAKTWKSIVDSCFECCILVGQHAPGDPIYTPVAISSHYLNR